MYNRQPQPYSALPPHSQASPSLLKGHLSCGPQNCGLQLGSMWPCTSLGTCYMPGACKGNVWGDSGIFSPLLPLTSYEFASPTVPKGLIILALLLPVSHPFFEVPLAPLYPGCLTWADCTGGSCGNRQRLPSGAAWTRACATQPSWTCKGARPGGRTISCPQTLPLA